MYIDMSFQMNISAESWPCDPGSLFSFQSVRGAISMPSPMKLGEVIKLDLIENRQVDVGRVLPFFPLRSGIVLLQEARRDRGYLDGVPQDGG